MEFVQIQRSKGSHDLAPGDMQRFRRVETIFIEVCKSWDYHEIKTPTLEYLHLFTSAGTLTQGMLKRVYSFLDWDGWSGERVVLKPDATIPAVRFYIEQSGNGSQQKTARYYYVANTFIFEETGTKNRERWQCGVEHIGNGSPIADVETVALALEIVSRLNAGQAVVKLTHAGLIRGILAGMGLSLEQQAGMFEKILAGGTADIERLVNEHPDTGEILEMLLNNKGRSSGFIKNIKALFGASTSAFEPAMDNFISVLELMEQQGIEYEIDLAVGKGFEYYTGLIFRLDIDAENVGGGGRYDQLIPMMGGAETPAAGFALYMDRLMALAQSTGCSPAALNVSVRVNPDTLKDGLELAGFLREGGMVVRLSGGEENAAGCDWEVRLAAGTDEVVLVELASGQQTTVSNVAEAIITLGCA
jgi:histidyl-tRNA synthetase